MLALKQQKVCGKCKLLKPLNAFRVRGNGRQGSCRDCKKQYDKKHYLTNTDLYRERNERRRTKVRQWLDEVKNYPCLDCGQEFLACVMEFDHRDGEVKLGVLSEMVTKGKTKAAREEMKKCDLVCANCHRIRTHNRRLEDGSPC